MPEPLTLLCAGGGTGGHIYPAIAIGERMIELHGAPVTFVFLCSTREVDKRVLENEPLARAPSIVRPIPAQPFSTRPKGLLKLVWNWGACVRTTRSLLKAAGREGAVHVLYTGGFVSAPVVRGTRSQGVAGTLINLDAIPGKANRFVARHLPPEDCLTAIPVPGAADWRYVGPVVRRAAITPGSARECRLRLRLDPDLHTLVVMGGSLGAESLTSLVAHLAGSRPGLFDGWQIFMITGRNKEAPTLPGVPGVSVPYLTEIGLAWGAADLVVSRAGAGSVAEAARNAVPTVFFPYPGHKDQHQAANARALETGGGAVILPDLRDPARTLEKAAPVLESLLGEPAILARMRRCIQESVPGDGAAEVARHILGHIRGKVR